jgi:hypothetical protein
VNRLFCTRSGRCPCDRRRRTHIQILITNKGRAPLRNRPLSLSVGYFSPWQDVGRRLSASCDAAKRSQYVQLWVQRMSRLDPAARFLPMLKWKPPGQLVEMVGIPTDRRPERDAFSASLFKNSGGQLIFAVQIDHCEEITTNDAKKCSTRHRRRGVLGTKNLFADREEPPTSSTI